MMTETATATRVRVVFTYGGEYEGRSVAAVIAARYPDHQIRECGTLPTEIRDHRGAFVDSVRLVIRIGYPASTELAAA